MPGAEGAAGAAKQTFGGALRALGKYLIPLGGVVAGYVVGGALGGARSIANLVWGATGANNANVSGTNANRIGAVVMAIISAGIGAIFWHMRGGGMWMEFIGGGVGGFFFGVALFNASLVFTGSQGPSGLVEQLAGGIQNVAQGG